MRTHSHLNEATGEPAPSVFSVFRRGVFFVSALVIVAACGSTASPSTTTTSLAAKVTPATGGSINWKPCSEEDSEKLACAQFSVPFDYAKPSGKKFSLTLVKRPASDPKRRIGSMLVNPGGPGFGGSFLPENASLYFSSHLLDRFDIVGWDPRGTGKSTPFIDCVSDYDKYFTSDPTPETDAQREALINVSEAFAKECEKNSGDILPYVSTNNTARDMDLIRSALGEAKITYFGFSYGSELGATWATMFPSTVRAAVLDGAADPNADYMEGGLQQATGFEKELTKFLARCSADPKCPFHNARNSEAAFDALMLSLDKKPLVVSAKRAPVNQAIAYTAVAQAMYSSTIWSALETALADAQVGKGAGLLDLNDQYYQRKPDGSYGNELEAFNAIYCLDDPGPKTVEESDSFLPQFKKAAPRLYPGFAGGYGCVFWPAQADLRIAITAKNAGPIIVIGTTGDAATPLQSSRNMASALEDGRLIVVTADRHTGYGENTCVTSAVDNYLLTTSVTFREKAC